MSETTGITDRAIPENLSPLEPRPTLTVPELQSAARYAEEKYGEEPEFRLTQDLETRHALSLFEAVSNNEISREDAATVIGARMGEMRLASDVDYLTELYNRGGGMRRLIETLYLGRRNGTKTSMMMIDLDEFKAVNDTLGHEAGDRAIQAVGGHLKTETRGSDVPFRYGGDEFGVILPNTGVENARVIAKKLCVDAPDAISSATEAFGYQLPKPVTFSAGLAEESPVKDDKTPIDNAAQDLIKRADRAAQLAKTLGKDRLVVSTVVNGIATYTDLSNGKAYTIEVNEKGEIVNKTEMTNG